MFDASLEWVRKYQQIVAVLEQHDIPCPSAESFSHTLRTEAEMRHLFDVDLDGGEIICTEQGSNFELAYALYYGMQVARMFENERVVCYRDHAELRFVIKNYGRFLVAEPAPHVT
jgi:hypothetical protein